MALNLDKTKSRIIQSALICSHSQTLAKYANNNNMPTIHAQPQVNVCKSLINKDKKHKI